MLCPTSTMAPTKERSGHPSVWAKRDSIPQALRCAPCRGHPHPRGSRALPEIDECPDQRTVGAPIDVGEEGLEPPTFRV